VYEDNRLEKLVKKAVELSEENNKLLHKIIRAKRWERIFKLVYWIIIIGLMLGAYYYIQPYVYNLLDSYQGIMDNIRNIGETSEAMEGISDSDNLSPDLIEKLKSFFGPGETETTPR